MIKRITRSLSARLLAIFLITSIVYVIASRYAVTLVLDQDYLRRIAGGHMTLYADYVLNDIGIPPDIKKAQAIVDRIPVDIRLHGPGLDWASNPDFPAIADLEFESSHSLGFAEGDQPSSQRFSRTLKDIEFARQGSHTYWKMAYGRYAIVFSSPRISETRPPDLIVPIIGMISILVLAACYFAVTWVVRPMQWIKEGAARIGHGELDYRIATTRKDDLGDLAQQINQMADDVQQMLEAKRQLLLAISHELRSPLTRAKVALEFTDDEELKQNLLEDIREMEQLVADLLESERLNTRHSKLKLSLVDIGALINMLVEAEFGDSKDRISVKLPATPVVRDIDMVRVRLMIKNLVENALRYTPPEAGPVEIILESGSDAVRIRVRDHGQGMAAEDLARATEPFYRADPSRCRSTGGFGLGLYLCRLIAEAHGGSLELSSAPENGTEVLVTLSVATPEEVT